MPFEMDSTISIHAPRKGGDFWPAWVSGSICDFNPRPLRGGRRNARQCAMVAVIVDFNPRPPRGGRQLLQTPVVIHLRISIHAPREGGDG